MSWADQGFSWDMTHPREVLEHLNNALYEKLEIVNYEGPFFPGLPRHLQVYDKDYFVDFDRIMFEWHLDDGISNSFSIPGNMELPDPSYILENIDNIKFNTILNPITIEYIEKYLGEPLIIFTPDTKNNLIKKLLLAWVIQRYKILNILTEQKVINFNYTSPYKGLNREYGEWNNESDVIKKFKETPLRNSSSINMGILTESKKQGSSTPGSFYFYITQKIGYIALNAGLHKSCDSQLFCFGVNLYGNTVTYCLEPISIYTHDKSFYRYEYNDYGYGIPIGKYAFLTSFSYDDKKPDGLYFFDNPQNLDPLHFLYDDNYTYMNNSKVFVILNESLVRKSNYAPYLKYYDPPE